MGRLVNGPMHWSVLLRVVLLLATASALLQTPAKATRFKFPFHLHSQGPLVGRSVTLDPKEGVTRTACIRKCSLNPTCSSVVAQLLPDGSLSCVHFFHPALVKKSTLKLCKPKKSAAKEEVVCKHGRVMKEGECVCLPEVKGQTLKYLKPDRCNYASWHIFFERSMVYRGRFYLFGLHSIVSWSKAREVCDWYGGYLAEIDDKGEDYFVRNVPFTRKMKEDRFWLGATDKAEEGFWVFPRTGNPAGFFSWGPREPNNLHNREHCQAFRSIMGAEMKMIDLPCDRLGGIRFICEIPITD